MTRLTMPLLAFSLLMAAGCVTMKLENSARLMARPDFEAATLASPEWVRDALQTINRLEEQLESD